MRELAQWVFEAGQGEAVSIRVVPRWSEARYVGVWLDDRTLAAEPNPYSYPYLIYSFSISKPAAQSQVIKLECNFSPNAAPQASYDLWISGSHTSGEFLRTVKKDDEHDVDIIFTITKSPPEPVARGKAPEASPPGLASVALGISRDCALELLTALVSALGETEGAMKGKAGGSGGLKGGSGWPGGEGGQELIERGPVESADTLTGGGEAGAEEAGDGGLPEGGGQAEEYRPGSPPEGADRDQTATIRDGSPDRPLSLREAPGTEGRSGDARGTWKRAKPPLRLELPGAVSDADETGPGARAVESEGEAKPAKGKPGRPRKRVVNLGFASEEEPRGTIESDSPLVGSHTYYFWVEVGEPRGGSLEAAKPSVIPRQVPSGARLKVALFGFKGELKIKKGLDVGELEMQSDGTGKVVRSAATPEQLAPESPMLGQRLFFPVTTPGHSGVNRLRCNIYYRQVLLQSHLITARVMARPRRHKDALRSVADYTLSRSFNLAHLASIEPHRLSLMLNSNGDGTVGLRFFGEKELKKDATFDADKLQDWIDQARSALRRAAWGDPQAWDPAKVYRYEKGRDFGRLKVDLIRLAKQGYAFYRHVMAGFAGDVDSSIDELTEVMVKPGRVQLALKESARHTLPAGMIYDYSLDDGWKDDEYEICKGFVAAFDGSGRLEESDCFKGSCPSREDDRTVCPSGFWGYRHYLGMPLSIGKAPEFPTDLTWQGAPHLTIAVSTSPKLVLRADHAKALRALKPEFKWDYAETRDAAFKLLKESHPHLVYFYCHGGLADNKPYIRVGPDDGPVITESNLGQKHIKWDSPRPLVFINGCHTTALEPKQAMEFVTSFIQVARAAGVIGTEITVFESLARIFAEECLGRFINGKDIGESIRGARLALLKAGNPLGLVYVPYVMTELRLVGQ